MTQAIEQAVCDILGACQPVKIILYAEKRTMATDKPPAVLQKGLQSGRGFMVLC